MTRPPLDALCRQTWLATWCLAATWLAAGWLAAGCAATGPHAARPSDLAASTHPVRPGGRAADSAEPRPGDAAGGHRARPSPGPTAPVSVLPAIGPDPGRLGAQLSAAERTLGLGNAPSAELARQALIVQLACLKLTVHPGWAAAVLHAVWPAQRAAAAADIAATADLVAITPPRVRLPPWRIIPALDMAALRADYLAAQAATGVRWYYLAAVNFVETDFGRIAGPSSAGAQGPMQFLPSTWASYGHGNIHRPRDAILAAARFLLDHGATSNISTALYAYNPSWRYVDAVLRYARRLRSSAHALAGYYDHQIIYRLGGGWVLLPAGYGTGPAIHAIRVHL